MPDPAFIETLDIFGIGPQLNIKQRLQTKSGVGFVLTILLIILAIICTYFFGESMFRRINPSILQSEEPGKLINDPIYLPPGNIAFAIKNLATGKYFYDPTIFIITAIMKVGPHISLVEIEPCRPLNITLAYNLTQDILCLKMNPGDLITLGITDGLRIQINKCNNVTMNNTCQDEKVIDTILKTSAMDAFWSDVSLDIQNFENPVKGFLQTNQVILLSGYSPRLFIGFKKVQVSTDVGFLTTDITEKEFTGIDLVVYTIVDPIILEGAVMEALFFSTGRLSHVTRRYQKVPDVLAQVMSVVNLIILLFGIAGKKYASIKMYARISNEVVDIRYKTNDTPKPKKDDYIDINSLENEKLHYEMKILNKTEQNEEKNQRSRASSVHSDYAEEIKGTCTKKQLPSIPIPVKILADDDNGPTEQLERSVELKRKSMMRDTKTDLSYLEQYDNAKTKRNKFFKVQGLLSVMLCKKRAQQEIKLAQEFIDRYLDITTIFARLAEIDTLKEVLLSDEQRYLFEHLKKPRLRLKPGEKNTLQSEVLRFSTPQYNVHQAYALIKMKMDKTDVDKNLLRMAQDIMREKDYSIVHKE